MPKAFTDCVKAGGKVVRIKPRADVYLNICYDKQGKAHSGETHHMESDAVKEIELLMEESSTASTAANPTATMGKVMKKPMPKGEEMKPKEKAKMKKKMKKVNKTGKMACAE
jgi:hypothetical protein